MEYHPENGSNLTTIHRKNKNNDELAEKILLFSRSVSCRSRLRCRGAEKSVNPQMRITTNMGVIEAELYADKAPLTVKNVLSYVERGYYNGTIFHRVIPGFMIQGGGFVPGLRQKSTGVSVKNEANNGLKKTSPAPSPWRAPPDPHSASAQFFINTVENVFLDHRDKTDRGWGYAVFGKVTKGNGRSEENRISPDQNCWAVRKRCPHTTW